MQLQHTTTGEYNNEQVRAWRNKLFLHGSSEALLSRPLVNVQWLPMHSIHPGYQAQSTIGRLVPRSNVLNIVVDWLGKCEWRTKGGGKKSTIYHNKPGRCV